MPFLNFLAHPRYQPDGLISIAFRPSIHPPVYHFTKIDLTKIHILNFRYYENHAISYSKC